MMRLALLVLLSACSFTPSGVSTTDARPDRDDARAVDAAVVLDAASPDAPPPCHLERAAPGQFAARVGGSGGNPMPALDCGTADLPIGARVRLSDGTTTNGGRSAFAVTLICAKVQLDPPATTDLIEMEVRGGGGFGWTPSTASPPTLCPSRAIVSGLAAHLGSSDSLLLEISIDCQPIGAGGAPIGQSSSIALPGSGDSPLTTDVDASACPAGTVMTGAGVNGGAGIDAVTPRCAPLRCAS